MFNDSVIQFVVNRKAQIDEFRRANNAFDDQRDGVAERRVQRMQSRSERGARRALAKQRRAHRLNLIDVGSAQIQSGLVVKLASEQKKLRKKKSAKATAKPPNSGTPAAGIESIEISIDHFVKMVRDNARNTDGRVSFSF
jgi:hypothetical protein